MSEMGIGSCGVKIYRELESLVNKLSIAYDMGRMDDSVFVSYDGDVVEIPLNDDTLDDFTCFVDSLEKTVRWDLAERLSGFIRECHGDGTNYYSVAGREFSPDEIDKHLYRGDIVGASIWMWLNMTSAHGPEELAEKAAELQVEMMELMEI